MRGELVVWSGLAGWVVASVTGGLGGKWATWATLATWGARGSVGIGQLVVIQLEHPSKDQLAGI